MSRNYSTTDELTRRRWLAVTSATLASALTGCTGSSSDDPGTDDAGSNGSAGSEDGDSESRDGESQSRGDGTTSRDGAQRTGSTDLNGDVDWPVSHFDLANSGSPRTLGPRDAPSEEWRYETDAPVGTSPVSVEDAVYLLSGELLESGRLHAVAADGTERWTYDTGPVDNSTPAVVDGTVYVGGRREKESSGFVPEYTGLLHAVSADDGTEEWTFETGLDRALNSPPTVADGRVFVRGRHGNLYGIDAETGEQAWSADLSSPGPVESTNGFAPAVVDDTLYVGALDGGVHALSPEDGSELWGTDAGDTIVSSVTVADGAVYVATYSGIRAFSAADGSDLWSYRPNSSPARTSPAVLDGVVYAGVGSSLAALAAEDGEERWHVDTGRRIEGAPVVTDGAVYLSNGTALAYATDDGSQLWEFDAGGTYASPTVVNGTAYVASGDGYLSALTA